jgi:pimeloyl-ACP methyl ester carboxylesterase
MDLNFKSFGQGPALVILHGLFGSLDNWQSLGKRFAERRTVYLVDQRNHGKSPHVPGLDYPAMADDLAGFFEAQGIRQASVLGHSMGGKTAMRFALDHPDKMEALVVADMAPKVYPAGHDIILAALQSLDPEELESRHEAERILSDSITDQGIRLFLLKNLTRNGKEGFRWKMNLPEIVKHYPRILEGLSGEDSFDGPTLFIRGSKSRYVEDSDWPQIHERFPEARLDTVADAGHWLHAEQPDAFFEQVEAFLDQSV